MARKKRQYTDDFKAEAIRLVNTSEKSLSQVARDLGIPSNTLYQWVGQMRVDSGEAPKGKLTTDEREELGRLRRELERVRQERDFLKKAAAFFAKDGN
jgi:transposase